MTDTAATTALCFNEGTTKFNADLLQDIDILRSTGFAAIEIRLDKLKRAREHMSLEKVAQMLHESGLQAEALNAVKAINWLDGVDLIRVREEVAEAVILAQGVGSDAVVLVPTIDESMARLPWQETRDECIATIRELATIAAARRVRLAIEPIGLANCAVRTVQQALEIVELADRDNVGLLLDSFNVYLDSDYDMHGFNQVPANRIFGVHVADSDGTNADGHDLGQENRVWPGHGVMPLCEIVRGFLATGYRGTLSVELFRPEYFEMDPRDSIGMSFSTLRDFASSCLPTA